MPKRYTGTAVAIKQVRSYTFGGTWAVGETVTVTIGVKTLVITLAGTVTTTAVATAVYQAYANVTMTNGTAVPPVTGSGTTGGGQAHPEFCDLVATNPSAGVVTLTGAQFGRPVTITLTTNSTAGTISAGSLTAATGPNHADDIDNWDDNDALANSDDLVFDFQSAALKYALDQSSLQFLTITKSKAYTDDIGLPEINEDNQSRPYTDWRERRLKTGHQSITTTSYLETGGDNSGSGSQLYRHNGTNGRNTWNVYGRSSQRKTTGVPCILLMGTHASNELNNFDGDVGFGFYADEASVLGTFRQGGGANAKPSTIFGSVANLTACTLTVNGGTVVTNSALCTTSGTILLAGGEWTHNTGAVKNLTIQNGTFRCKDAAAFTGTNSIHGGGKLDLSQGAGAVSFATAIQLYKGAEIDDPNGRLAATTQFVLNGCDWSEVKINLGKGRTLTKAA